MRRLLMLIGVMASALVACVTPYGQPGFMGGVSDWSRGPGRHHIEANGNAYTGTGTLREYFNRRALELCRSEGFNSYEGDSTTESRDYVNEGRIESETRPTYGGGYRTETRRVGGYSVTKSAVQGDIICTEPNGPAQDGALLPPP